MGRWSSKKSVNNRRSYGKSRSVIKYSHLFLSCLHFSYCYCLWAFISLFAVAIYELSLWNAVKWWLKTGFKQIKAMFCSIQEAIGRPWQGGGPMSPVWILKCLMSVFINACRLLSALPSLSQFGRGRLALVAISFYTLLLLFGPCHLSEFTLAGPQ